MIDIHTHILPGIDDGSSSVEESLEMAGIMVSEGTSVVVATPHVEGPEMTPDRILKKAEMLNRAFEENDLPLSVVTGGEVVAALPAEMARRYTINGSDYVLSEFPLSHMPANAEAMLMNLVRAGLKPIIAHPERNPSIIANPDLLIRLVDKTGSLVQVTSGSVSGAFGRNIKRCAEFLLKKGVVHVLASDSHSMRFRKPGLLKGVKAAGKLIGRQQAEDLVLKNPGQIIKNLPVI